MERGTILFHNNFEFSDETRGEKQLLLLNTPKNDEPYLLIKTTSQVDKWKSYYKTTILKGCNYRLLLFLITPDDKAFFSKPTLLQFDDIFPRTLNQI
jgi:hypothetical protein